MTKLKLHCVKHHVIKACKRQEAFQGAVPWSDQFYPKERSPKLGTHDWMGRRVSLDRVTNRKISSSDAEQAQAIEFVTLLTEQCNYIAICGTVQ